MGAKLISTMYNNRLIDTNDAKTMLSFTSISGPMFMIGTIGVAILGSFRAGIVIMIANILAGIINGLLYRNTSSKKYIVSINRQNNNNSLSDIVYDSMISILMVGAYIVISFLIIEVLQTTKILDTISSVLSFIVDKDVVYSILTGIIEITRGSIDISSTNISLIGKTIISSTLIAFGGISIMLQSLSFLKDLNIPARTMLLQKFTQAIIALIISIPLAFSIL